MLIFEAALSRTLKLRQVDAQGHCWTWSVHIHFMHQEGSEARFSKKMHAVLSGLMRSSAHCIAKPLYSRTCRCIFTLSAFPEHTVFSDNKAKYKSRTFQRWDMGYDRVTAMCWRDCSGPCESALSFYNLIIPPPITPWLSCTYMKPAIIHRKLKKRRRE